MNLASYRFTPSHEWCNRDSEGNVLVGITQHAVDMLKDLLYVQLPKVGSQTRAGESCAEIESVKSVGNLYAPCDGTVVAVNESLAGDPMLIAESPYEKGWIVKIKPSGDLADNLVNHDDYQKLLAEEGA
ncbi:MAG TPA: glycine cleavage system protein GcvH [Gemmatales bacterium]|nr:glycine cleavage system protein GcvH [Gemmatales bacterium]